MSDLRHCTRDFILELIDLYHSYPCLWNVQIKDYTSRQKKKDAYDVLVKKYREVEPKANRDTIIKKINSLRTVYRKELNKVIKSQQEGREVYKPSLYYYDRLSFLTDVHMPSKLLSSSSNNDDADAETKSENIGSISGDHDDWFNNKSLEHNSRSSTPSTTHEEPHSPIELCMDSSFPTTTSHVNQSNKRQKFSDPDEMPGIREKRELLRQNDDEFDDFARHIANKLRGLEKKQNIFAQKLINDVVFEAEMESLTRDSKLVYLCVPNCWPSSYRRTER
ncbi:uncharacterized protein LOC111050341 [Nilaparvata lugens]|uniref:uncharacterized protein LOC111050341 n=1 Tax=Nilaparvata lugens TaxID=108931 RepID=UPI00193CB39A|nr:uncharacterized protein LOC111050341 [Nilaparvata lugens]